MNGGLIVLLIVVGISLLITVASNWLRNQQRQLEVSAAEKRARSRSSGESSSGKAGAGDIDRFLEEINKLRQKPATTAEPSSRPRKAEPVRPVAKPVSPPVARRVEPVSPPVVTSLPRLEDLPVAPVVARPVGLAALPPAPGGASKPIAPKAARPPAPLSPFGRQLTDLLADPKSLPLAVVLQEILGPPKCKRPPHGPAGTSSV